MNVRPLRLLLSAVAIAGIGFTTLAVGQESGGSKVSIWKGVYTEAQSKRGEDVHEGACASCHGPRLNGAGQPDMPPSPAIAREGFLRKWAGKSLAELFNYVHTKMPPDNPGTLTPQQSADAIAHMLAMSNLPPGEKELPSDANALGNIVIEGQQMK